MKRYLKVLTAIMTAGVISSASQIFVNSIVYADTATSAETTSIDTRPHFDTEGYVVVDDLQFHKTSDTTVEVFKGKDFNEKKIVIPSSISVDDVRFAVTSIADNAFKDEKSVYAATKIIIPSSIQKIGNNCFFSLDNIQYLDLSQVPVSGFSPYCLALSNNSKIDRIKMQWWYTTLTTQVFYGPTTVPVRDYSIYDFNEVSFLDESSQVLSYWLIKSNVRINELQDTKPKNGYTFSGWQSSSVSIEYKHQECQYGPSPYCTNYVNHANGVYSYYTNYTNYTPIYEKGQPIWDAEDKIKVALSTFAVDEDTKETDILKLIESCLTFDNIAYDVENFRISPSQDDVRGALRCTINLTNKNNNEKKSIDVDLYTTELPTSEKLTSIINKYNNYTEATTRDNLIKYVKEVLDDNGLDVSIENFINNKRHIQGNIIVLNKLDGLKKVVSINKVIPANIKLVIEDAIKALKLNTMTNEESVVKQISRYVNDSAVFTISIVDFKNANGKVTGTVVAKDSEGISTLVDLNVVVPERSQSLANAFEIVKSNLASLQVSDNSTYDYVLEYLSKDVNDGAIEISIPNFRNKNGAVKGTITLVDVEENETKTLDLNMNTIEGNINKVLDDSKIGNKTTSDDIYKQISEALGSDDYDITIEEFKNEDGHVTAVIVVTKKDGTVVKIPFDKTVVHQTVEQAAYIINKNLTDYVPSASTTGSQVIRDLSYGIKDVDIEVTIPDFNNDGTNVTGTIKINKADGTSKEISLNKKIAISGSGNNGNNGDAGSDTPAGSTNSGNANNTGYDSGSVSSSSQSNPVVNTNPNITTNPNISSNPNITVNPWIGTNPNVTTSPTISGGSSSSSTGAINLGFNPVMGSNSATSGNVTNGDINVNTPVNVTVNLNESDILKSILSSQTSNSNESSTSNINNDDLFNLLLLQYMKKMQK